MEKQFVTYEIALKLKELGFDEECLACFQMHGYPISYHKLIIPTWDEEYLQYETGMKDIVDTVIYAPLWQQAVDWLREKYLIDILILPQDKSVCDPLPLYFIAIESYKNELIEELFNSTNQLDLLHYTSPDEARKAAILKAIEIIKQK